MGKIEKFLRKLFGRCEHVWEFEQMVHVNEFGEDVNNEIVSSSEYSMQRCKLCKKVKFRKL